MNKKRFISVGMLVALAFPLVSCSGEKEITIWVGEESVNFYKSVCAKYLEEHSNFGYKINVVPQDTGSVAGVIEKDAASAADIYTVAHDNIGKLASQNAGKPITMDSLVNQVKSDNSQSFIDACYSTNPADNNSYLYGVPYISQALFLYYDKRKVTAEQAQSFEGLVEAAKAANTKAFTVTGSDGYNNSFTVLARYGESNSTSVKIYESGVKKNCYFQGDDTIASLRWYQDMRADDNGFTWPSDSGWTSDVQSGKVLSVIGGSWHANSFQSAVGGEENVGVAPVPTYTISESQAEGLTAVKAGTKFHGGSFVDCKVFMINGNSDGEKYQSEQELIQYLSSKEIQNQSFAQAQNIPAYSGFLNNIDSIKASNPSLSDYTINLAKAQNAMTEYGIPQPFKTATLNTYYYSKKAPELYQTMIDDAADKDGTKPYDTLEKIRQGLFKMEYIWVHGSTPDTVPSELPASSADKIG